MENGPPADFEMYFYNGVRVHNSVVKSQLQIKIPAKSERQESPVIHTIDTTPGKRLSVPQELTSIFQHVQECLRQCVDIEKSGKLDPNTTYPVILKSSSCTADTKDTSPTPQSTAHSFHPSTSSTYTSHRPKTSEYAQSNVRPTSHNPLSTYDRVTVKSDSAADVHYARSTRNSTPLQALSQTTTQKTQHARPMKTGSAGSISNLSSISSPSLPFVPISTLSVYMENVGWCVKTPDGRFTLLFNDGIILVVESKHQILKWCDKRLQSEQYHR
jgi:hypothetical protein